MAKTTVKQPEDQTKEVPTEVLATSIIAISEGMRKLRSGRLTDRALFLLLQDAAPSVGGRYGKTPVSMKEIKAVMAGLENLETAFIKKKKPAF
jgi:hypothetical protein